ncbi:MAG: tRNA lysidine(34) synthetase TilS [Planctomycetaceae bacterium]|nr:tRNA lysidine(34) synthetase TilS [Planctomycetaceae bacterium]
MSKVPANPTSSTAFLDRIAACLLRAGIEETRVVVAVSGGADSTALLLALYGLRDRLRLKLTAAHLDHGWRSESAADAEWVARLCTVLSVDVVSRRHSESMLTPQTEAAARTVRRQFLAETAAAVGAAWIATAHTADDQVETVLHRLLRGTGPRGLAGMSAVAPFGDHLRIVRPMLDVGRSELEQWLTKQNQSWRTDLTNSDTRYTRNRIRHTLLPLLREQFNPQVDAAVLRLSRQCGELSAVARTAAEEAVAAARLDLHREVVRLDVSMLTQLPRPVLRELFVVVWAQQQWPEQSMGFNEWELLAETAAASENKARFQLPGGIEVTRDTGVLRLSRGH